MKDKITLSPKHGINAAIPLCFYCMKEKNEILLPGKLSGDMEAPRNAVWDDRPCDTCAELMKQGVILVSVKNGESGDNPYRTGAWVVVRDEFIARIVAPPTLRDQILKKRFAFLEDATWDAIGLPRGKWR